MGRGVYEPGEGSGEGSLRATWERSRRILSHHGGFQVSTRDGRGEQGEPARGEKARGMLCKYTVIYSCT